MGNNRVSPLSGQIAEWRRFRRNLLGKERAGFGGFELIMDSRRSSNSSSAVTTGRFP